MLILNTEPIVPTGGFFFQNGDSFTIVQLVAQQITIGRATHIQASGVHDNRTGFTDVACARIRRAAVAIVRRHSCAGEVEIEDFLVTNANATCVVCSPLAQTDTMAILRLSCRSCPRITFGNQIGGAIPSNFRSTVAASAVRCAVDSFCYAIPIFENNTGSCVYSLSRRCSLVGDIERLVSRRIIHMIVPGCAVHHDDSIAASSNGLSLKGVLTPGSITLTRDNATQVFFEIKFDHRTGRNIVMVIIRTLRELYSNVHIFLLYYFLQQVKVATLSFCMNSVT